MATDGESLFMEGSQSEPMRIQSSAGIGSSSLQIREWAGDRDSGRQNRVTGIHTGDASGGKASYSYFIGRAISSGMIPAACKFQAGAVLDSQVRRACTERRNWSLRSDDR